MGMETPLLTWASLVLVAAVAELALPQFGMVFVSVGAGAAAAVAWFGGGGTAQVVTFSAVTVASLLFIRPRVVSRLAGAPGVPSRTARLLHKQGQVTEAIDPVLGTGRVTVAGEDWAARCATAVPAGAEVTVVGSEGIVLEVSPL